MNAMSSTGRRAPSPTFIDAARHQIRDLMMAVPGIDSVLLSSTDGFELVSVYKRSSLEGGKMAAVSSSILALVEAFLGEIDLHGCQSLTLEAENGKALISAIPAPHHPMVLVIVTSPTVLLGHVMHATRHSIQRLTQLDQQMHRH